MALCATVAFSLLSEAPAGAAETSVDIVIIGGSGVVSDAIMADLDSMTSGRVTRLAGPDRYATAAAVSVASFDPGVPVVYIANGLNFPDALAAAPVAALQGGPVLLTLTSSIPGPTREELQRLEPERIVVVGGTGVVDESVFKALRAFTDGDVERLAGLDRDETAAAISASHFDPGVPAVYIALGRAFPDALAASATAAVEGGPILLTKSFTIPVGTANELIRLQPERIFVVGGPATIPDDILEAFEAFTDGPVQRLAGPDRYGTAAAVSASTFNSATDRVYIATGLDFPDALAAGPIAGGAGFVTFSGEGSGGGPILLVSSVIPTAIRDEIRRLGQDSAPIATPMSVTVAEDTPTPVTLAGTDPEGDPLTFDVVTDPNHGTLAGSPPTVTYTPDPDYHGPDSFTFRATDGASDSANATVTITVTPVNDAPVVEDDAFSTAEDTPIGIVLTGTDVEGDSLSFSVTSGPSHGSLSGSGSNRTYTPDPDFSGADSFTYIANDGVYDSAPATIDITVDPVNDAPVAADQDLATAQDTPRAVTLTASDAENDPLTFTVTTGPSNGSLSGSGPNRIYTPDLGFFGVDSFTFVANDGTADSNEATVTVTVTNVNDAPTADDKNVETDEDTAVGVTLTGSDPDNDPLTFTVQTGPANGSLSGTAPNLTYTPDPEFSGPDSFTYVVNDGTVNSPIATVSITVSFVNDPPIADDQSVTTDIGVTVNITVTGSDPEDDPITFALAAGPSSGQLIGTLPDVSYKPQPGFSGTDSFTFTTNDGNSDSNIATVTITVNSTTSSPSAGVRIE